VCLPFHFNFTRKWSSSQFVIYRFAYTENESKGVFRETILELLDLTLKNGDSSRSAVRICLSLFLTLIGRADHQFLEVILGRDSLFGGLSGIYHGRCSVIIHRLNDIVVYLI
jgi:hypothetical protein